jgi:hypothetical protein
VAYSRLGRTASSIRLDIVFGEDTAEIWSGSTN